MEKKKKTIITIVAIVLLIVLIVVAVVVSGKGGKSESEKGEGSGSSSAEKAGIKDYDSYGNYKLTTTASMKYEGIAVDSVNDGTIDVKNKRIKSTITTMDIIQYYYFDINNNTEYYSYDNNNWFKNADVVMFLPDFSSIISKVRSSNSAASKGEYKLTTDLEYAGDTLKDIPVTITFTDDGYISKIVYDLTSTRENVESYVMTYELTDIGTTPDVEVPGYITRDAASGNEATVINYLK